MKTLVVGDIHGHKDSVKAALAFDGNVVFVGDFMDSFSQSVESQFGCLADVLDAIQEQNGRVTGLLGNHELSYLDPEMRCSGWNEKAHGYMIHIASRVKELLLPYAWINGVLVSHAGVSQGLLDELGQTLQEYLEKREFYQIGYKRGGKDANGGLFWNDFNTEMIPVPGLTQVVGHSNWRLKGKDVEGVRLLEENGGKVYNVDNLNRKREGVVIDEKGEVSVQEF